jgi:hypothetical protein
MFKHWRAIVGLLFFLQPAWQFIKWGLDWAGRIDLITSHLHDLGLQAVLNFIANPPAWFFLPSVGLGLLLIWWDVKRKEAAEIELNKKLLIGFYSGCTAVAVAVWGIALPLYFPPPAPLAPPPSNSVEPPKAAPSPPPKLPWLSQEEINQQQSRGRSLLIYSPQEIFAMLIEGQNINVFGDRWVKVEGVTSSIPASEKIQTKESYRVDFKLENVNWSYGKVAAYFDPKKYGEVLLNTRLGGHLRAVCQLTKVESKQPYAGYSITEYTFAYYNCEPL